MFLDIYKLPRTDLFTGYFGGIFKITETIVANFFDLQNLIGFH